VTAELEIKRRVRDFYDSVGWREISDGVYQNARYEDLRPVTREYIHRCHLRVRRHLPATGRFLLDAGSGPIQYPEYLEYSRGYRRRVCLDVSSRALSAARDRIGAQGLFVVGDVSSLPFRVGCFDGIVSLHTLHHLPAALQAGAFSELYRVLGKGGAAVVVQSWGSHSALMRLARGPIAVAFSLIRLYRRKVGVGDDGGQIDHGPLDVTGLPRGTFTQAQDYQWIIDRLQGFPGLEVRVWRSVSTSFLRAFIHRRFGGVFWLRLLYAIEECLPHLLGRLGQYAMILFSRADTGLVVEERAV
jgi:SAM-dependent methyltransferase